eukprot:jgi/Galph1/5173/GphlegSOOS_G3827.1
MGKGSLFVADTYFCSKVLYILSIATILSGVTTFILGIWIYMKEGRIRGFSIQTNTSNSGNQVGVNMIKAIGELPIALITMGGVVVLIGFTTCLTSKKKGRLCIPLNLILLCLLFLGILIISLILYIVPRLVAENSAWQKSFELNVWIPSVKEDPTYIYAIEEEFFCAGFDDDNCATNCSTPPNNSYSSSYACYFTCPGLSAETNSSDFPQKSQAAGFEKNHVTTGCFESVVTDLSVEQAELPTSFPEGLETNLKPLLQSFADRGFRILRNLNVQKGSLSNVKRNFVLSYPSFHVVMLRRALDGSVVYLVHVGSHVQGPSGFMHGGATAALLDDCVSSAVLLSGPFAMTVQMNVQYRKPVPLNSIVVVEGFIDHTNGRKIVAGGKMYHPDGAFEPCVFVKFYAPWCSHCKKMIKDFEEAASALHDKAVFAQVDSTEEKTLKLFVHGQFVKDYYGKRKAKDMISFVRSNILSPWKKMESELAASVKGEDEKTLCFVLSYVKKEDEAVLLPLLDKVARPVALAVDGTDTLLVTSNETLWKEACAIYNIEDNGEQSGILSIRRSTASVPQEDLVRIVKWNKDLKEADLSRFVCSGIVPRIGLLNATSVSHYKATGVPVLIAFVRNVSQIDTTLLHTLSHISESMSGTVNVVLGDWQNLGSLRRQLYIKDEEADHSALVMHVFQRNKNYVFPRKAKAPKVKPLRKWIEGVLDGTVEGFRRSEKPPMPNQGFPKVVVGDTWRQIVEEPQKDVFILQYAHWLDKSREAEVLVDEIAKEVAHLSDKLIIAKMNAVDNDAPDPYFAHKYPTMHYFPAGSSKAGIPFNNTINRENILEFLKQHATFSWTETGTKDEL